MKTSGIPFQQGQHICCFYNTGEEQLATAADYVAQGLRQSERCLYAADSPDALARFCSRLNTAGLDAQELESRGALLLLTKAEAHLLDGAFDSERMLGMLNAAVEDALNAGFAGLRTCGDMTWLLDDAAGSENVIEYEALLNQFFKQTRGLGMCQYDLTRLPAGLLDHAGMCGHSSVVIDGTHKDNPFYAPKTAVNAERFDAKLALLRAQ